LLTSKNKDSFCPGHWDDIQFAPSQGYMYGCCKAKPILLSDTKELEKRRTDALNGIKNPACSYCWDTEAKGNDSYRHSKLSRWHGSLAPRHVTLVVGNLCNLQCTYCNEKASSKWQTDRKQNGQIDMQFDTNVYYGGATCDNKNSQVYIDFFNKLDSIFKLTVSGGEPLIGTDLYDILSGCDLTGVRRIHIASNLNYPNTRTLDKLLELQHTHRITINASLDTVNAPIQEYLRFGFNWETFKSNLDFLLTSTTVNVSFGTLVTAQTVFGINDMYEFVYEMKHNYPNRINWFVSTCTQPLTHTFDALTDTEKARALTETLKVQEKISNVQHLDAKENRVAMELININTVIAALQNATFNEELRQDQQHFFKQFNERNGLTTPEELKFLIEDEIK